MLTPFGVLREPHIGSGRKPGPGQRVGVLDKQVGRRSAVRSRTEVRLHAEMNLRVPDVLALVQEVFPEEEPPARLKLLLEDIFSQND